MHLLMLLYRQWNLDIYNINLKLPLYQIITELNLNILHSMYIMPWYFKGTRGKAHFARLPLDWAENIWFCALRAWIFIVVKFIFWNYESWFLATEISKISFEVGYVVKNKF